MNSRSSLIATSILASGVMLTFLTSCGRAPAPSSMAASFKRNEPPVLALLNGRGSCDEDPIDHSPISPRGADTWIPFQRLIDTLEAASGVRPAWITSCRDAFGEIYYLSSTMKHPSPGTLTNVVYSFHSLARGGSHDALLLGHSYGGYDALKFVPWVSDHFTIQLVTIDPISPEICGFTTPSGCVVGPADITGDELQSIAGRVISWMNFYQTQTSYLHSTPIPHATQNVELSFGHTSIDTAPPVWSFLETAALNLL